jgi:anti-sigma factor ChrR (cupin superfamily)
VKAGDDHDHRPALFYPTVLHRSLIDIFEIRLNEEGLERLGWRDMGKGLSMARLARQGERELVLYRISPNAPGDAFSQHEHPGGEFYLVLKGQIADETGVYKQGDIVFLDRKSVHTPKAVGETLVLVLWPEGVRLVE